MGKKTVEEKPAELKPSFWAAKASEDVSAPSGKFAPLELSTQQRRMERTEQEFKFSSKKEQEERRKKRELEEAVKKPQ